MNDELIRRVRDRAASLQNGKSGDPTTMSAQLGDLSILILDLYSHGCGRECATRFGWPACVAMVTVVLSVAVPVTLSIFRG
jgi:hypothetical protein